MNQAQKILITMLRLSLGWFFLYAGLRHISDPSFSALGYISHAQFLGGFYNWLANPNLLPYVNFVNAWGLTLLGISLVSGVLVSISAPLGAALMILYWLPLGIIHPDVNSYIIDKHIIFASALLVLAALRAGSFYSLGAWLAKQKIIASIPGLSKLIG